MSDWDNEPSFKLDDVPSSAIIKVVGVGGGGGNAVRHMIRKRLQGVEFIAINTDEQALDLIPAETRLTVGYQITEGLGAGCDPQIGEQAALEDADKIAQAVEGAHMVFIAAGMGGGTGTGAAPVVAKIARERGILTLAVVTQPYEWECRDDAAEQGLARLQEQVHSLITVSNDKLSEVFPDQCSLMDAFQSADDVLFRAVEGISDLIVNTGHINADFADVRTVMSNEGAAMMGTGRASGDDRSEKAVDAAIDCPLLDDINLSSAAGVLVNITSGPSITQGEYSGIGKRVRERVAPGTQIVTGWVLDETMQDEIKVTIIAAGLDAGRPAVKKPASGEISRRSRRLADPGDEAVDFDVPTLARRQASGGIAVVEPAPALASAATAARAVDSTPVDLSRFLQRQAD